MPDLSAPPWNFTARPYQAPVFEAHSRGIKRQFHVWHRRAGKDRCGLALTSVAAFERVAAYWYCFPLQTQVRRSIWNGIDRDGNRFIDQAFPLERRRKTRDSEMLLELDSGSTVQFVGSDNYNSMMGANVGGIVFSEWALCDPAAWPYFLPIIRESGGWAVFITTFRAKNHAWRMFQEVRRLEDWFCTLRTVDDTTREDGTRVLSPADVAADAREGMTPATIREEYFCEAQDYAQGSFYGRIMQWLSSEGRIGATGYEPALPLFAAWHVSADALACILTQTRGTESRIVASRAWRQHSIADALEDLRESIPFARHIRKCITKESVHAFELAGYEVESAPKHKAHDAVEIVRRFLPSTRIDNDVRAFAPGGNNRELLDSLNGCGQKLTRADELERAGVKWEEFLADAVHTWAAHVNDNEGASASWGAAPNYRTTDRAVI